MGQRRGARAVCLADRAQTLLWPPPRVVQANGRALFRDVVGASRASADRAGGGRAAPAPAAARAERPRIRLGKPAGGAVVEIGALRVTERGHELLTKLI